MRKKTFGFLLALTMTMGVAAGCADNSTSTTAAGTQAGTTAASEDTTGPSGTAGEGASGVTAEAVPERAVFVSPNWIQSVIDGNQPESEKYVIWEVAWGEESDSPTYAGGHLKGAVHMNTDRLEEPEDWNIRKPEEIEALMKEFGVTSDTAVIVYSDTPTNSADDRAAFAMLWAGVKNVKVLDGGLEAWTRAGYELETQANKPTSTEESFGTTVPANPQYILTYEEVLEKQKDENFKLVSIRSRDEFLGKTSGYSYISKAGEPKGAIWGHDTDDGSYNREDGTVVDTDVLSGFLSESGASLDDELAFYCGTGWRAAMPFLIAYEEGHDNVAMYDGGWFVWQKHDELEVQVGNPLSGEVQSVKVKDLSDDKARE